MGYGDWQAGMFQKSDSRCLYFSEIETCRRGEEGDIPLPVNDRVLDEAPQWDPGWSISKS